MWHKIIHKLALIILIVGTFIAVFHSVLFNEKPIAAKVDGQWYYPAFGEMMIDLGLKREGKNGRNIDFKNAEKGIYPPIQYSFDYLNRDGLSYAPPLTLGSHGVHYLGTDKLGRDVFAGIGRGFYIAFKIGTITLFFTLIIGIMLGLLMGFYGDTGLKWNIIEIGLFILGVLLSIFYALFPIGGGALSFALPIFILTLFVMLKIVASTFKLTTYQLPFDMIMMKIIELFKSIPSLVLLLAMLPLFSYRGAGNIIIILVFVGWRNFARHVRAETMAVKEKEYVSSAFSQGQSDWRIMVKQILPNVMPTVLILSSFAFASIVLLESSLSFLGIGLPVGEVSWGSLLAEGRENTGAWWLSVFPGLCIFFVLFALNIFIDLKIDIRED